MYVQTKQGKQALKHGNNANITLQEERSGHAGKIDVTVHGVDVVAMSRQPHVALSFQKAALQGMLLRDLL